MIIDTDLKSLGKNCREHIKFLTSMLLSVILILENSFLDLRYTKMKTKILIKKNGEKSTINQTSKPGIINK